MRVLALFGDPWGGEWWRLRIRVGLWTSSASLSFPPLYTISELGKESSPQVQDRERSGWEGKGVMRVLGRGREVLAPNYSLGYSVVGIVPSIKHSVMELSVLRFGGAGNGDVGGRKFLRSTGSW